jgi:UDP-2-acetamido-2,6-beta-L-arabino-hexul-4-ose reductase
VLLADRLVQALFASATKPHLIFASSTQEGNSSHYGISKEKARIIFSNWARQTNSVFTGLIIPNVFGPFARPFYNSVVATFCHQLCNGYQPEIKNDNRLNLIHVHDLSNFIINIIRTSTFSDLHIVKHSTEYLVSEILNILSEFKKQYFDRGVIPSLTSKFAIDLFNTFRSYINLSNYYPMLLKQNTDIRGTFVEIIRLNQGGQVSFSTTLPAVTRGNHFHTRKIERFVVVKGKALIQLRKYNTKDVIQFELDGTRPGYVDMPVWYAHNLKNVGDSELITMFWINEFFDPADPDTFFETV